MLRPITSSLALAFLLVGQTATAQATPAGRSSPRSVVLTGKAGESPLISVAPGTFTLLILDAQVLRESVQVENRARFAVVDVGDQIITLSPRVALGPTERLALRITYREGFPTSAMFLLTGQPGAVDEVVNVSRPQQTAEACRVELADARERCEALSQALEELKARPPELSPAAVALAGFVDNRGMIGKKLLKECNAVRGELLPVKCWGLGGVTWSVVVLEVSNTGAKPWAPAWAEVTPTTGGAPRRARAVLSGQGTISPGGVMSVAVEVEMPERDKEDWLQAPHTLRVCNGDGGRCLSVPVVTL